MATAKGVIKNINKDQHRILADIMTLYCPQGFECDPTYSKGYFYKKCKWVNDFGEQEEYEIPQPKYKFDVYPLSSDVQKLEVMGEFLLKDNSIKSINIDLPFVISCGPSIGNGDKNSNIISNRFSAFYPVSELVKTYYHFLKEAYRVLEDDGICVFKCQRTITGSKTLNAPEMSWLFAESLGFDCVDQFFLEGKSRLISGKIKSQQHSRSYVSIFYVFKKSKKKKIDYLTCFDEETQKEIIDGVYRNNVKCGGKFLNNVTNKRLKDYLIDYVNQQIIDSDNSYMYIRIPTFGEKNGGYGFGNYGTFINKEDFTNSDVEIFVSDCIKKCKDNNLSICLEDSECTQIIDDEGLVL